MRDWLGCMPDALSKRMVISGPRFVSVSQASQAAITAVTNGTAQIQEIRRRRSAGVRTIATGSSSLMPASRAWCPFGTVPDQPGIERPGREHGQDHDRGEGDRSRPGSDGHNGAELDDADEDRLHENVEHGPTADGIDDPVEHGTVIPVGPDSGLRGRQ